MFSNKFTEKIEAIYEARKKSVPDILHEADIKISECGREQQILLRYLYGNMPLSDMENYPFETYQDYAAHGVYLWEKGQFKGRMSEEIFCQYVVYHRVNTEDISPCRRFFFDKVNTQVDAKSSMEEAVLALNYWCAQEVTYRVSDNRTVSPFTAYRSAYGRCGEESTFTVSVLRSMGIPARQVYTPRWSHCDDNHAWVEAWCDGKWYFLGACEPEEVLNKGWFLHASSRAMLIHSRWYGCLALAGDAVNKQDIVSTQGITTEINAIAAYANTGRVSIRVEDAEHRPVKGAQVRFEVLNYSEFYPIAVLHTEEDGTVQIELGLGSVRVYVSKGEWESWQLLNVSECKELTFVLGETGSAITNARRQWQTFECFAPTDAVIHSGFVTEEQKALQKEKVAEKTAIRLKKTGTGNEAEVEAFRNSRKSNCCPKYREPLLSTLSDKDFLDLKAEVLEAHLSHAVQYANMFNEDIFVKYILSPRISNELLTSYRQEIDALLTEDLKSAFRKNPAEIWTYLEENIRECPQEEYESLLTFPGSCLKYKTGSRRSAEILFVAICRTLGIPARLNPVDGMMEYDGGQGFVKVIKAEETKPLWIRAALCENFVYTQNWSVTKKYPGGRKLMDLSGVKPEQETEVLLPSGTYEVITANRLPNGNVLGRIKEVTVGSAVPEKVELKLEEAELSQMLECVPVPAFDVLDKDGRKTPVIEALRGRSNLVVWLAEGQEPTEHILNELCERAEEFNKEEAGILFLVNDEKALKQPTLARTMEQVNGIRVLYDSVEERVLVLGRRFYVDPESIPLILVTDKDVNCVYAASGYNVGTADMILKILEAI